MKPTDEALTVVQDLCGYFDHNPQACDTPAGIGRWWLHGRYPAALVEQALDRMHRDGLLERLPAADGRVRYRRTGGAK